jgi:hypothetical protein
VTLPSWLVPLLDPSEVLRRWRDRSRVTAVIAFAQLIDGRFGDYLQLAQTNELPAFGARWDRETDPQWALVATLTRQLSGEPDAPSDYEAILDDERSTESLRTVAAVLAAVSWSDYGDTARSIEVISRTRATTRDEMHQLLLMLHHAENVAERGDVAEAFQLVSQAVALSEQLPRTRLGKSFRVVASHDRLAIGFSVGEIFDPATLPRRADASPLVHFDSMLADGLGHQLEAQFDAAYKDPYDRSFTWRSQDPVESPLFGALLQSAVWADHFQLQRARKLVGRYRVLSAAGVPERQPEAGFELLRRARDTNALRKAIGLYRRVGPEGPLRNLAVSTAEAGWLIPEEQTVLEIVRWTAEYTLEDVAGRLIERLLSDKDLFSRSAPQVIYALTQLVQVAPESVNERVAAAMLAWLPNAHPLILMSSAALAGAITWSAVSRATLRRWIEFLDRYIAASEDVSQVAESAVPGIADVARGTVVRTLKKAYRRAPNLTLAGLLAGVRADLDEQTSDAIADEVVAALASIRNDAHRKAYSGWSVDVALLAHWVAETSGKRRVWNELADFILDPAVAASQKTNVMDALAQRAARIPRAIAGRLRESVQESGAYAGPLFGPFEAFEGSRLRLGLALGAYTEEEVLAELIRMSRGTSTSRVEALRTIGLGRLRRSQDLTATLAVALAGDADQDVAAYAARTLGTVAPATTTPIRQVIKNLLTVALQSPGSIVRREALNGLNASRSNTRIVTGDLRRQVEKLATTDVSAAVRFAAARLLNKAE